MNNIKQKMIVKAKTPPLKKAKEAKKILATLKTVFEEQGIQIDEICVKKKKDETYQVVVFHRLIVCYFNPLTFEGFRGGDGMGLFLWNKHPTN